MLISQLLPTLQVAIGPVVLISGIGLLILSMTNRFGRVIDRGRILARELAEVRDAGPPPDSAHCRPRAGRSIYAGPSPPPRSVCCLRLC